MKTFEKRTGRFVPGRTNIQTGDIIKFKRYFTQIKFELYLCRGENELTAEEYIKSSYSESEAEDLVFLIAQITGLQARYIFTKECHLENCEPMFFIFEEGEHVLITKENVKFLFTKIIDNDFSIRVLNAFEKEKIVTIEQLVQKTKKELLQIKNFGKRSLKEVEELLKEKKFALKK